MDWLKIMSVVFMVLLLVFLFPRAKYMLKNSPKGNSEQWMTFSLLMGGVALFVIIMIWLVR